MDKAKNQASELAGVVVDENIINTTSDTENYPALLANIQASSAYREETLLQGEGKSYDLWEERLKYMNPQERAKAEQEIAAGRARMQKDDAELDASTERAVQKMLALVPEDDRAAYLAGFLRHHDLIRTEKNGVVSYAPNPDEERPHSGFYVPAAVAAKDKGLG